MKNTVLILFACLTIAMHLHGQPIQFNRPEMAPLNYNPGFAGSLRDTRIQAAFHTNMDSLRYQEKPIYLSYDQLSNRLKGGLGVEAWFTSTDILKVVSLGGIYAAKISLGNRWTLSPSAKVRLEYKRLKYVYLIPPDQFNEEKLRRLNLYVMPGLLLNSPNFYLGVAIDNLPAFRVTNFSSTTSQLITYVTPIVQAGYHFSPGEHAPWSLALSSMARWDRNFSAVQGQLMFRYKPILAGGGLAFNQSRRLGNGWGRYNAFCSLGFKHEKFRVLANLGTGTYSLERFASPSFDIAATWYLPRKAENTRTITPGL